MPLPALVAYIYANHDDALHIDIRRPLRRPPASLRRVRVGPDFRSPYHGGACRRHLDGRLVADHREHGVDGYDGASEAFVGPSVAEAHGGYYGLAASYRLGHHGPHGCHVFWYAFLPFLLFVPFQTAFLLTHQDLSSCRWKT